MIDEEYIDDILFVDWKFCKHHIDLSGPVSAWLPQYTQLVADFFPYRVCLGLLRDRPISQVFQQYGCWPTAPWRILVDDDRGYAVFTVEEDAVALRLCLDNEPE